MLRACSALSWGVVLRHGFALGLVASWGISFLPTASSGTNCLQWRVPLWRLRMWGRVRVLIHCVLCVFGGLVPSIVVLPSFWPCAVSVGDASWACWPWLRGTAFGHSSVVCCVGHLFVFGGVSVVLPCFCFLWPCVFQDGGACWAWRLLLGGTALRHRCARCFGFLVVVAVF